MPPLKHPSARIPLPPVIRMLLVGACLPSLSCSGEKPTPFVSGTLPLSEVSGVAVTGDTLVLVADDYEGKGELKYHMILTLKDGVNRLRDKTPVTAEATKHIYRTLLEKLNAAGDPDLITDLEDIARAPDGTFYLISSHSLNKKNKSKPERERLIRLKISPSGEIESAASSPLQLTGLLPDELKGALSRRPGEKKPDGSYDPGFNIEGMAWAPGNDLLIGLRSPLKGDKAVVLRLKDADAAITGTATSLVVEKELDLVGMGIRGMCYDEETKGYWLIAGISPDPDEPDPKHPNDWSIWQWDGTNAPVRKFKREANPASQALGGPEAICVIGAPGATRSLLLISDDGAPAEDETDPAKKQPRSSYVIIPLSALEK